MTRTVGRLSLLALFLATVTAWPLVVPVAASPGVASPISGTSIRSVIVRLPQGASGTGPYQVLLALHGIGGSGEEFSKGLLEQADHYGWLIVAPTIDYGDWTDPAVVAAEEPKLISALSDYVDQLPEIMGVQTGRQVLLLGHSRGAQLAHRFAEFRPDRVLAVSALSAGTYTLPQTTGPNFPFGLKDLPRYAGHTFDPAQFARINFWVGVGGLDTNSADLPHQWDSVEGATRVERAHAFDSAMRKLGANSVLRVFGNAGHGLTNEMRQAACEFLGNAMLLRAPRSSLLSLDPITY